ncbi:MAG: hypothetical protein L3K26_19185, partial [Candidatus Hydrogenedentes bacterium]|nr:hypothetical protein [Candidatus Hydrogenedentota bacterium]
LVRTGLPVYVTPESRTSVQLLRVLCQRQFGDVPRLTDVEAEAPARLLIGDATIEYARTLPPAQQGIDLGAWWMEQTGLPFVFAQWVVSKSIGCVERDRIVAWLERCARGASHPGPPEAAGVDDEPHFAAYHRAVRPRLTWEDLEGRDLFLQRMESMLHVPVAPLS